MVTLSVPLETHFGTYFILLTQGKMEQYPKLDTFNSLAVERYISRCESGETTPCEHVDILDDENHSMFYVTSDAEEFFRGQVSAHIERSRNAGSNVIVAFPSRD